jgi:hypothetical protein
MYDPTWVPYNNEIWSKYETEQQYLIGSPEGEPLRTIPYDPPEGSPLRIEHNARLYEDGALVGTLKLYGSGAMDSRLRNMASWHRMLDIKDDLAELLSHVGARVEDIRYLHPRVDDFSQDMWIEMSYRIPDFAFEVADGFEFKSPMMTITLNNGWLCRACVYDWADEREGDLFLWFTQLVDGKETIRLPSGYEPVETPSSDEVDETYGYFVGESEMDGGELIVTQEMEVRRRQIPPDGYEGFKKAVDEAKEFGDIVYRIEKGGD